MDELRENTKNVKTEEFNRLKEILILTRYEYQVCTANESIDDLSEDSFKNFVLMYKKTTDKRAAGLPRNISVRDVISRARAYIQKSHKKLSKDEIIEYKKLGILPLNINENGIDVDTNLPKDEFEFLSLDIYGFDKDGYYYKKQDDGSYINTGLKYNQFGFKKDRIHVITKKTEDIRYFNIDGKCILNGRQFDKSGFKQDGTHKNTGELYFEGYNAFNLDENGRNRNGKIPGEIVIATDFINGISTGKINEVLKKYEISSMSEINLILYTASEMYPKLKQAICDRILKYQTMISQREEKLNDLLASKSFNAEQIAKLEKENEVLRKKISLINPMQELDR